MKTLKILALLLFSSMFCYAQNLHSQEIDFNVEQFLIQLDKIPLTDSISFPVTSSVLKNLYFTKKIDLENIQTFSATNFKKDISLNITLENKSKFTGLINSYEGYFIIESISNQQLRFIKLGNGLDDVLKCEVDNDNLINDIQSFAYKLRHLPPFPVGNEIRKYRLAVAATGEFVNHYGSQQNALSKIIQVVNAVNLIYKNEASIEFEILDKSLNNTLLFTNPSTDPFQPDLFIANANQAQAGFNILHQSKILEYSEYDLGHVFHVYKSNVITTRGSGGGAPCNDAFKATGWTEWSSGLNIDVYLSAVVNLLSHEIGHQFSAHHTYNAGKNQFCEQGWSGFQAVEPGSGSTLMGYGSNCASPVNYVLDGDNYLKYFHSKSLEAIYTSVNSYANCFTSVPTENRVPVANAGGDIMIPKKTPFYLKGLATDPDEQHLSFTWEQVDVATLQDKGSFGNSVLGVGGYSAAQSTTAPLFRGEQTRLTTVRYFPRLNSILNHKNSPPANSGEVLPEVERTMKFRFTVRDNHTASGGVDSDEVLVQVVNAGPFEITTQNTPSLWLSNGAFKQTIRWSVNGTNLAPLNVSHVTFLLSVDGGQNFKDTLIAHTPNIGQVEVVVPKINSNLVRIKMVPDGGGYFFDINDANITITDQCDAIETSWEDTDEIVAYVGDSTLNLNRRLVGKKITRFSGKISAQSATSNLLPLQSNSSCSPFVNSKYHQLLEFEVLEEGDVTFSNINFNSMLAIYSGAFEVGSICKNWLASSVRILPTFLSFTNFTYHFKPGNYTMVVFTFGSGTPVLPMSFDIGISGNIYQNIHNSGSSYANSYILINNETNLVDKAIDNLNLTSVSAGEYKLLGVNYTSINPEEYVGKNLDTLKQNALTGNICCAFSQNYIPVKIQSLVIECEKENHNLYDSEILTKKNGDPSLLFSPGWAKVRSSDFVGNLTSLSLNTRLIGNKNQHCEIASNNMVNHEVIEFSVLDSGNYIFNNISNFRIVNIYRGKYTSDLPCNNWLASSLSIKTNGQQTLNSSLSVVLNRGIYTLVVSNFSIGLPSLPSPFSIKTTAPVFEKFIDSSNVYKYVVKDNNTGLVVSIADNVDLRMRNKGEYTVYGLISQLHSLDYYIDKSFEMFSEQIFNGVICASLSSNTKRVQITESCQNELVVQGVQETNVHAAVRSISSSGAIEKGSTVQYIAGAYILIEPKENESFVVMNGAIFKAEIGNCQ